MFSALIGSSANLNTIKFDWGGHCRQLLQELDGHSTYINSLTFDEEGHSLYSGDSMGVIRIWNVYATEKNSSNGHARDATPAGDPIAEAEMQV